MCRPSRPAARWRARSAAEGGPSHESTGRDAERRNPSALRRRTTGMTALALVAPARVSRPVAPLRAVLPAAPARAARPVATARAPRPAILGHVEIDVERCLTRAAEGDQRAFAELYDATAPRVFGLVLRILVDRSQAEEVAQEVFLEAWRNAKRFDATRGAAISWLLQIAHARAVDRVRASQAQRDRDARIGVRDTAVPVDLVAEQAEVSLESARARRALAELSDAHREAIELAYFGGLTQTEIAERLGAPLGTVKTRLRDGMRRLREILGVTT